MIKAMT